MCGIAGCTWSDAALVSSMAAAVAHRGPDQWGLHVEEGISLGHRRLAIVDLTAAARQPMANEDGALRLVFNGEIYNFAELRLELEGRGHRFASGSDGEVILHLYEERGDACVEALRGMFAFALWDRRRRRLLLARDRLGIKPLYWTESAGRLLFASEIKALLADPRVPREVDPQALYHFLGFEMTPAPATLFRGVHKLPPGCTLSFADGRATVRRYWDLAMQPRERPHRELLEEVRAGLQDAVRSHLMADVPVGVLLSGGLDSSALAVLMSRAGCRPLRAFSLYYQDGSYSELDHARHVARSLGAEHHELLVERVSPRHLELAAWHLDEPMTDPSALPFFLLCREVRRHVKVCLSGEGGDEVMVGYDRFRASRLHHWYARLPLVLRRDLLAPLVAALPERPQKKGAINLLQRFVAGGLLPEEGGHLRWQYFLPPALERELLAPALRGRIATDPFGPLRACAARHPAGDRLAREIFVDTCFYLPDSPLMKVDKLAMAHGLEVRVPFLDHRFVELWATIPSRHKMRGLTTKALYREAMRGVLPERIRRRGKQGYSLPVKHWLRGELRELLEDTLASSPLIRDAFARAPVTRLLREHAEGRANHGHLLWALLNLAIWHRLFVAPVGAAQAPGAAAENEPLRATG
jgi:asparagine synthase (glutamine-hydrolysing)